MKLIAITGGIGTGKSIVSRLLSVMGYPVYDCDSEAKRLMVSLPTLIDGIKELVGDEAYFPDGTLNRAFMSSRIFTDSQLVQQINALVHPAVLSDIERWAVATGSDLCFVETALLNESNMTSIIDGVWVVTAPLELRISRVAARSNLTREQTLARIANQATDFDNNPNKKVTCGTVDELDVNQDSGYNLPLGVHTIINDGLTPLIPQILSLLK